MEQPNLINITSSRWDGSIKSFTKLCPDCEFLRVIDGEKRCYWGVAYKVLDETETLSYCQLTKKPSPRLARLNDVLNQKSKSENKLATKVTDYHPAWMER